MTTDRRLTVCSKGSVHSEDSNENMEVVRNFSSEITHLYDGSIAYQGSPMQLIYQGNVSVFLHHLWLQSVYSVILEVWNPIDAAELVMTRSRYSFLSPHY